MTRVGRFFANLKGKEVLAIFVTKVEFIYIIDLQKLLFYKYFFLV